MEMETVRTQNPEIVGVEISGSENSKLEIARKSLRTNSAVIVVGEVGNQSFPNPSGYWSQTVEIVVAPLHAISSDELDDFTRTLVPHVDPTCYDSGRN